MEHIISSFLIVASKAVVDLFHQEPVDVFDSAELRNRIYNLDDNDDDEQERSSEGDSARTCVGDTLPSETTACESEDQGEGKGVNVDEKQQT
jgi:hypothetical protein